MDIPSGIASVLGSIVTAALGYLGGLQVQKNSFNTRKLEIDNKDREEKKKLIQEHISAITQPIQDISEIAMELHSECVSRCKDVIAFYDFNEYVAITPIDEKHSSTANTMLTLIENNTRDLGSSHSIDRIKRIKVLKIDNILISSDVHSIISKELNTLIESLEKTRMDILSILEEVIDAEADVVQYINISTPDNNAYIRDNVSADLDRVRGQIVPLRLATNKIDVLRDRHISNIYNALRDYQSS